MKKKILKHAKVNLTLLMFLVLFFNSNSETYSQFSFLKSAYEKGNPEEKTKNRVRSKKIEDNELYSSMDKKKDLVFRVQFINENKKIIIENKRDLSIKETEFNSNREFTSLARAQFYRNKIWETTHKKTIVIILLRGKKINMSDLEKLGY